MNTRVHVLVSGKVQGVFFRSSTKNMAEELGLSGWVRNLADGRVEALFEGKKEVVETMIEWIFGAAVIINHGMPITGRERKSGRRQLVC